MALTDELREWAKNHRAELELGQLSERNLIDIANRIQKTATTQSLDAWFNGYSSAIDEFCDKSMHLPVDADGVPIHVNDRLYGYGKTIEVVELRYGRGGWSIVSSEGNAYFNTYAFTHHHAPTVEDVLREFADRYLDYEGIPSAGRRGVGEALMDEYAAKLRLEEESATI